MEELFQYVHQPKLNNFICSNIYGFSTAIKSLLRYIYLLRIKMSSRNHNIHADDGSGVMCPDDMWTTINNNNMTTVLTSKKDRPPPFSAEVNRNLLKQRSELLCL